LDFGYFDRGGEVEFCVDIFHEVIESSHIRFDIEFDRRVIDTDVAVDIHDMKFPLFSLMVSWIVFQLNSFSVVSDLTVGVLVLILVSLAGSPLRVMVIDFVRLTSSSFSLRVTWVIRSSYCFV